MKFWVRLLTHSNVSLCLYRAVPYLYFNFKGGEIPEDEKIQEMLIAQLGKTEISLTLTNKFEVPQDDQADVKQLLIRYLYIIIII